MSAATTGTNSNTNGHATVHTGIPPTINKPVLTVPGAVPSSKALLERLLEEDRILHHCFFGIGFHNHRSHHLFAAYDLGAPPALLQSIFDDAYKDSLEPIFGTGRAKDRGKVGQQDVQLNRANWKQFVGQDKFYASFVEFFAEEVKRLGGHSTFEHYVFSEEANKDGVYMIERFVGGALHPLIQMGYAVEFGSDAMIPQALAQCAIHDAFVPELFPWNQAPTSIEPTATDHTTSSSHSTTDGSVTNGLSGLSSPNIEPRNPKTGHSLLNLLREVYDTPALTPVLPYDPDALLAKRRIAAFTPLRISEIRRICGSWHPAFSSSAFSDSSQQVELTKEELEAKLEELAFFATVLLVGGNKPNRKLRLDFFLMHILTSSVFVLPLVNVLKSPRSQRMLLAAYLPVAFGYLILRGRPRIDCDLVMSLTDTPTPFDGPSVTNHTQTPAPNGVGGGKQQKLPWAVGNPNSVEYTNAWARMLPHVLPANDSHTIKAFRSLYVFAQRHGTVQPGEVIGAFYEGDEGGRYVESHKGAAKLDGSVFVRAAGAVVQVMGWVGPGEGGGQEEGEWDRSALGWDDAWKGED